MRKTPQSSRDIGDVPSCRSCPGARIKHSDWSACCTRHGQRILDVAYPSHWFLNSQRVHYVHLTMLVPMSLLEFQGCKPMCTIFKWRSYVGKLMRNFRALAVVALQLRAPSTEHLGYCGVTRGCAHTCSDVARLGTRSSVVKVTCYKQNGTKVRCIKVTSLHNSFK